MWPNPLRLASSERRDEGKAGRQPTQRNTNPPPEHKNPKPSSTEETLATPTPEKLTAEEAGKTPTPGKHIPDCLLYTCLLLAQVNRQTMRKNPNLHP